MYFLTFKIHLSLLQIFFNYFNIYSFDDFKLESCFRNGFFIGIVSFVFLSISGKYSKRLGIDVQSSQLDTGKAMKEGLSTVIDSKLLNIEFFFPKRFFKYMMINARANWRHVTLGAVPSLFFEILALSILVGFVFFIITNNIDLEKVLPILGLFSFAFVRLLPTVSVMIKIFRILSF